MPGVALRWHPTQSSLESARAFTRPTSDGSPDRPMARTTADSPTTATTTTREEMSNRMPCSGVRSGDSDMDPPSRSEASLVPGGVRKAGAADLDWAVGLPGVYQAYRGRGRPSRRGADALWVGRWRLPFPAAAAARGSRPPVGRHSRFGRHHRHGRFGRRGRRRQLPARRCLRGPAVVSRRPAPETSTPDLAAEWCAVSCRRSTPAIARERVRGAQNGHLPARRRAAAPSGLTHLSP